MKSVACASILALFLLSFVTPQRLTAQNSGPSANGSFQFSLEDGLTRSVEFNARMHTDGRTTGEMTFSDPSETQVLDLDGTGSSSSLPGAFIKTEFDCLVVNGNRAVMSGIVKESNLEDYMGLRVLLVVEDNGEGVKVQTQDKLTWGLYRAAAGGWIPADAELEEDGGALLTWTATDAERPDDVGVPSKKSDVVTCQSFPLSSYSFVDLKHGDGNIQVRP